MSAPIFVDGKRFSIPEFQAAHGLTVGGSLDLMGTGITALPDGLTVGGWLDLMGTGIKPVGKDRRGYEFFAVYLSNGPRVIAGCRNFTPEEARAHWPAHSANGVECRALAEKCIAALEKEAAP